ncbi:hypothetical protein [Nocardioides sp. TF02-7]|uniref:hypothetical protein n=1 Tax=Nocardioides sp. TF02-7 TaxID=2917724 RepID=UPI001F057D86|nr:hypothetical protein [Nocardioides sp. TF02-7]UMG91192.1 hypothetical protein MF408_13450 [Nocardioides sp. TF02-7]
MPHPEVGGHVEARHVVEVLVEEGEPEAAGVPGRRHRLLLPVDEDLSRVRGDHPRDDLDQRALACAVLADEAEALPWPDVQVDLPDGVHPEVGLHDAPERDT